MAKKFGSPNTVIVQNIKSNGQGVTGQQRQDSLMERLLLYLLGIKKPRRNSKKSKSVADILNSRSNGSLDWMNGLRDPKKRAKWRKLQKLLK
jgi:hypothetical protein